MPENTTTAEVVDEQARSSIEDLSRRIDVIPTQSTGVKVTPLARYGSFGAFLKASKTSQQARDEYDELVNPPSNGYEGGVMADSIIKETWVGDYTKKLLETQEVVNAFSKESAPTGTDTFSYLKLVSDTTKVDKQKKEGDKLPFGKISFDKGMGQLSTYGGYTSLSFQTVELSSVNYLSSVMERLGNSAAKSVENMTRAIVEEAYKNSLDDPDRVVTKPENGPEDRNWISLLIELYERFDKMDRTLSGLFVSRDVYVELSTMTSERRFLQISGQPADKAGTVELGNLAGNLAGIKVNLFPEWEGRKAFAYDKWGIVTMQSAGGVPWRLQDQSILTLTRDISVYMYATAFCRDDQAIQAIDMGTGK